MNWLKFLYIVAAFTVAIYLASIGHPGFAIAMLGFFAFTLEFIKR